MYPKEQEIEDEDETQEEGDGTGRKPNRIEDENDHEARQDRGADEWGSLFDEE